MAWNPYDAVLVTQKCVDCGWPIESEVSRYNAKYLDEYTTCEECIKIVANQLVDAITVHNVAMAWYTADPVNQNRVKVVYAHEKYANLAERLETIDPYNKALEL